eukprot:gnl/TRDRNA2_/TRDRNA2_135016_c0_seq3.p1 gnl/TRDRNA2_/TRDRNA2_135016_c0~~gnl/TRDRNA2_/TRDRNA2_135016_c0_seq3.p1  ORF type:complete len:605 (-),score=131.27 gnl/TRDRNA2_/TRDRNA2_135016_c0_seq3:88-1902(-)
MAQPSEAEIRQYKEYQEYTKKLTAASDELVGHMCWIVDWFNEDLPLENDRGDAMIQSIEYKMNRGLYMGMQPAPPDPNWPMPEAESILVFTDSYGYCKGILNEAPAGRVGRKKIVSKDPAKMTIKEIETLLGESWDLIIYGFGIDPPASNDLKDIMATQVAVTRTYLWILQTILRNPKAAKRLVCLTVDQFADETEIHEECGMSGITHCTLFGLTNSARLELEFPILYIDSEWSLREENMPWLASEVFRRSGAFGVGSVRILNDGRYVLRQVSSKAYEKANTPFNLPEEGHILAITGGNGALALVMGTWLLEQAAKQQKSGFIIKFYSRSMKINDQNMPTWKAIQRSAEKLGIVVEQDKLDCSKQEDVDKWTEANSPKIGGIIHTAGVLQDGMLTGLTWEKFETVYQSKHWAAYYMHEALEKFPNPDLKFFWLFSSVAVYGNMGQTNYSSSNSCLDGLARHRRALGKPCMAVQWGAWGDVGMAANLDEASKRRMVNSPMPYFSNPEGLAGLEAGLRAGVPYFAVFKFNPQIMAGAVQGDQTVNACQFRNFTSLFVPLPPPSRFEPDNAYNVYKHYSGATGHAAQSMVMKRFVDEMLDPEDAYEY